MRILVSSCALALLLSGGSALAQGIALIGDAELGLGYNIDNDGYATGEHKLRAVSSVEFGVEMTGESASGITFGAEIYADDAEGGQGGTVGQFEGFVFVEGGYGRLTYGDTDGADYAHVGDLNEVGLTCLGCESETPFISNGGGFGNPGDLEFAENPYARPTVRYDFDFESGGVSISTNRDLTDVAVGASWTGAFGDATITLGGGYDNFAAFTGVSEPEVLTTVVNGVEVLVPDEEVEFQAPGGEQWSAALGGTFGDFNAKAIYTTADSGGDADFSTLGAGFGGEFGSWELNMYYTSIYEASGTLESFDGQDSYGVGLNYDLGGEALLKFGYAETFDDEGVSDFGISMEF